MAQEERDTNQCVTTVVQSGIDDSAITLTTDDGTCLFHLGGYVDLTYSSCIVLTAVLTGHITQGTCGAEVGDGIAGCMFENIISNGYKSVFLTVHGTVLINESKTVHIRVNHEGYITATLFHEVHDVTQILFKRFGVMLEITGGLTVELIDTLNAQGAEQLGENDATNGVDAVNGDLETGLADGIDINQVKSKDSIDMTAVHGVISTILAQVIYIGIGEGLGIGKFQDTLTIGSTEELSFTVEQFERIPMTGVMAGGEDDTSIGLKPCYGKLGGRCGGQADIRNVKAHTHEGTAYHLADHLSGEACITAYYNMFG